MQVIIKIVCLVNLAVCIGGLSQSCGTFKTISADWRIIGGTDAKVGEFPWHSLIDLIIEDKGSRDVNNFCGGSIINERWVLTAGHCLLWSKANQLKVRFGVHNFTKQPDVNEVDINVDKFIIHEKIVFGQYVANDIALIKLKENLDFNGKHKHLSAVCLATNDTKLTNKCVVTGFGLVNETTNERPKDGVLQKLTDPLVPPTDCLKQFPKSFDEKSQICVGDVKKGRSGVCYLDSGGPLQCQSTDGRWYQVGTVSYGTTPCDSPQKLDVFMKVTAYRDWIQNTIKNN